ncbi:MAG: hypothetical protein HUJ16_05820 [Kangiella sp.]|nr:hypothetical protein [Kangiella sp.]
MLLRIILLIFVVFLLQACGARTNETEISEQSRAYITAFYHEYMPLTEGDYSFRRTKFHGQTDDIYLVIDKDAQTISLIEAQGKSIVAQAFDMLKAKPYMPYSDFKNNLVITTVVIDEQKYSKFQNQIYKIEMATLIDKVKKREGNYRIEVVADGESFQYSTSGQAGYTISTKNNSDSEVVVAFMALRSALLEEASF